MIWHVFFLCNSQNHSLVVRPILALQMSNSKVCWVNVISHLPAFSVVFIVTYNNWETEIVSKEKASHLHLLHVRTAPRDDLLKGNLARERELGEEGECVGGGGTEEQVVVRAGEGSDGVFLSETSLNTERLSHRRMTSEAEQEEGCRGLRRKNVCSFMCVLGTP